MREVKPTQNPVPSADIKDLFFNSGLLDIWATSLERKYIDRFGNCHLTAAGMEWLFKELVEKFKVDMNTAIVAAGYITIDSFQQGAQLPNNEITLRNHILRDETTGEYYHWDGDLPKQVPAGSTPQSTGGIGKGAWVSVGDASLRSDLKKPTGASSIGSWSGKTVQEELNSKQNVHMDTFNLVMAKMASGETVKICCYGDSTTDGMGTTDWVANPTVNGDAAGNSNHNLTAPNAWPAQLQMILREAYRNQNIHVYNAGYTGKKLIDGWAFNNFNKAVIDNPFYGVCDLIFVDFGLNDITESGDIVSKTIIETERLVDKILSLGSVPVLLSSGPMYRSGDEGDKDKIDVIQKINKTKQYIADKLNLTYIDKASEILNLLNSNINLKWSDLQPDGLHFGNVGHKIQVSSLMNHLYSSMVRTNRNNEYINFMDPRANSFVGSSSKASFPNTLFGCNALVSAPVYNSHLGYPVMDIYLYTDDITDIIYFARSSDGQRYGDAQSKIVVVDLIGSKTVFDSSTANTNTKQQTNWLDQPLHISSVQPGFYNIKYLFGDAPISTSRYFGCFLFSKNWIPKISSYDYRFIGNVRYPTIGQSDLVISNHNNSAFHASISENNRELIVECDLELPKSTGVVILGGMKADNGGETSLAVYHGNELNLIMVNTLNGNNTFKIIRKVDVPQSGYWATIFKIKRINDINYLTLSIAGKIIEIDSADGKDFDIPVGGYVGGSVSFRDLTTQNGMVKINNLSITTKDSE